MTNFAFPETVKAALGEVTVRAALLLEFDFLTGVQRIWNGYGNLVTKDGKTWQGLGDIGTIDGLDQAINGAAPKLSIKLSAVTPYGTAVATNSWVEARGRTFTIYLQFFDMQPAVLDYPAAIKQCTMEQIEVAYSGPTSRELTVNCEDIFAARGFPIFGWLSDYDQQARFPGDNGLSRIPLLQYHTVTWPRA